MKLLSVLTVLVGSLGSASATLITYNTTGSGFTTFNGGVASGNSVMVTSGASTATLTYTPIAAGSQFNDAAPGTNLSYGFFTLSYSGPDVSIAFPAFTFALKVTETAPGPMNTFTVTGSASAGLVSKDSSNLNVAYSPTSFVLPAVGTAFTTFTVFSPTQIVASTTNGGVSSIQGFALGTPATTTPEPASMFLIGAGLIGVGFSARKKLASRS